MEKKCKKAKWLSEETLQIAEKRREAKGKGEKERYTHLNTDFQTKARRDKKASLSDQCKEIEENNRMWKTTDLFKKIRDTKGIFSSVQFSSVAQSFPTLCDPMNRSMLGLSVHHQLRKFTQTHIHRVSDTIQPSHPLLSPSPPAPNPSQHQSLFQWVNSSYEVAKVLEFQL